MIESRYKKSKKTVEIIEPQCQREIIGEKPEMVESAVRRNSLTYQFGLVASIKLDVLRGIFLDFGSPFPDCFSTSYLCLTALSAVSSASILHYAIDL